MWKKSSYNTCTKEVHIMNPGAAIHQSAKKCCAKLDATIFTVQTATVNSALRGHRRLFPNLLDYGGGGGALCLFRNLTVLHRICAVNGADNEKTSLCVVTMYRWISFILGLLFICSTAVRCDAFLWTGSAHNQDFCLVFVLVKLLECEWAPPVLTF